MYIMFQILLCDPARSLRINRTQFLHGPPLEGGKPIIRYIAKRQWARVAWRDDPITYQWH
jgi:hypothetical protein